MTAALAAAFLGPVRTHGGRQHVYHPGRGGDCGTFHPAHLFRQSGSTALDELAAVLKGSTRAPPWTVHLDVCSEGGACTADTGPGHLSLGLGLGLTDAADAATPAAVALTHAALPLDPRDAEALADLLDGLAARGVALRSATVLFPTVWPKAKQAWRNVLTAPLLECLRARVPDRAPVVLASRQAHFNNAVKAAVDLSQWTICDPRQRVARGEDHGLAFPELGAAAAAAATRVVRLRAGLPQRQRKLGSSARRSVDYLLQGESVVTNPYLARFAAAPYLPALLAEPAVDGMLRRNGAALRKELVEAYAVIATLERNGIASAQVVVDLCSGSGYLSLLLTLEYPDMEIVMIDKMNLNLPHLEALPRVTFVRADVTIERFAAAELPAIIDAAASRRAARIAGASAAAAAPSITDAAATCDAAGDSAAAAHSSSCVALGIHLCGPLSPLAADLFAGQERIDALVLVPCCLEKHADKGLKAMAKLSGDDPYDLKVQALAASLNEDERIARVDVHRDTDIRSKNGGRDGSHADARNLIVLAEKRNSKIGRRAPNDD